MPGDEIARSLGDLTSKASYRAGALNIGWPCGYDWRAMWRRLAERGGDSLEGIGNVNARSSGLGNLTENTEY